MASLQAAALLLRMPRGPGPARGTESDVVPRLWPPPPPALRSAAAEWRQSSSCFSSPAMRALASLREVCWSRAAVLPSFVGAAWARCLQKGQLPHLHHAAQCRGLQNGAHAR